LLNLHADCSVPPVRDQPAALVSRHVVFLDRLLDRGLLVRSIVDVADELGLRPADVVDGPGVGLLAVSTKRAAVMVNGNKPTDRRLSAKESGRCHSAASAKSQEARW
jgi:hypothetical protein